MRTYYIVTGRNASYVNDSHAFLRSPFQFQSRPCTRDNVPGPRNAGPKTRILPPGSDLLAVSHFVSRIYPRPRAYYIPPESVLRRQNDRLTIRRRPISVIFVPERYTEYRRLEYEKLTNIRGGKADGETRARDIIVFDP